jgi:hypothetical protein
MNEQIIKILEDLKVKVGPELDRMEESLLKHMEGHHLQKYATALLWVAVDEVVRGKISLHEKVLEAGK